METTATPLTKEDLLTYGALETRVREMADRLLPNDFIHSIDVHAEYNDLTISYRDRDGDPDSIQLSIDDFLRCTSKENAKIVYQELLRKQQLAFAEKERQQREVEKKAQEARERILLEELKKKYEPVGV